MDKKPKLEFSKLITLLATLPWICTMCIIVYYTNVLLKGNIYITENLIQYMLMYMVAPSFAPFTLALTCYYIKTKAENLIKLKIYSVSSMIRIQEEYPQYMIYRTDDVRQDAGTIDNTVENKIDNMMMNAVNEEPVNTI